MRGTIEIMLINQAGVVRPDACGWWAQFGYEGRIWSALGRTPWEAIGWAIAGWYRYAVLGEWNLAQAACMFDEAWFEPARSGSPLFNANDRRIDVAQQQQVSPDDFALGSPPGAAAPQPPARSRREAPPSRPAAARRAATRRRQGG